MTKSAIRVNWPGCKPWLRTSCVACFLFNHTAFASQLYIDMQTLTSPEHAGRKAGIIDAPNTSANYLHKRFTQLGYKPEFQTFSFKAGFFKQALGHNVIAELPCNATPCGKMIVITAHYDHLGGTASSYYAGANDNASGTSALLYLAEHLKQTERHQPITFLATDAEESGLYGAKHYVKTITPNEIALNINLDMLAPTRKNRLYVLQSKPTPPAINTLKALPKPNFYLKIANSRYKMQRMMDNPRIDWHRR